MDRLSFVIAGGGMVVAGSLGCDASPPAAPRSRVDAVKAPEPTPVDLDAFCERRYEVASAPPLVLPKLRSGSLGASGKPRWINVWATWCKPCIEELPRLARWHGELAAHREFDLVFLSADKDPEAIGAFAAGHPEVAGSLALEQASTLDPWVKGLGLAGSVVLPVHIFVDAQDRVRCLRSAGIGEDDRPAVERLLTTM